VMMISYYNKSGNDKKGMIITDRERTISPAISGL